MNITATQPVKGLIIARSTNSLNEGAIHTYSREVYAVDEAELAELSRRRESDGRWGDCWRWRRYTARENHGVIRDHRYLAGGIDLKGLLCKAGLTEQEMNGRLLFSAINYRAAVDHPLSSRYCFEENGAITEVPALLALRSSIIMGDGSIVNIEERAAYPKLFFGQRVREEVNQCSFVHSLCKIQPTETPTALKVYIGERLWTSYSLADLVAEEQSEYSCEINPHERHFCQGIDLCRLLKNSFLHFPKTMLACSADGSYVRLENIYEGGYFIATYSIDYGSGEPQNNSTALKLYGSGLKLDNLTAVILPFPARDNGKLPLKMPVTEYKEIFNNQFYCAVERSEGRLYYYFSKKELESTYPLKEICYSYDDHKIQKTVHCRGILLSDIIDSLVDADGSALKLPDNWQIHYLEEDGYHTNTPTYIDSISSVRGGIHAILAHYVKDSFEQEDDCHTNAKEYTDVGMRTIYRCAPSANESAVKGIMGIIIRGQAKRLKTARCWMTLKDERDRIITKKQLNGLLPGMDFSVSPPPLPRYEAISSCTKLINVTNDDEITFKYRENNFFIIKDNYKELHIKASEICIKAAEIPESLKEAEAMLLTGDAAAIEGDDDIAKVTPNRKIYLDRRRYADGTMPFGFDNLFMYRYEGWSLAELLDKFGINSPIITAVCRRGPDIVIEDTMDCFVAFRRTSSKGVPYNTAEYKRLTDEYSHPMFVSRYDGSIIACEVVKLRCAE